MKTSLSSDFMKFFGGGGGGGGGGNNAAQAKKVTRDGQTPKRRGPKPDSKPALTRRQELNRQAQRTHRERKEQYVRTLETELSRLREAYTQDISSANATVQQQRQVIHSVTEENDILKEILSAHGISYEAELERRKAQRPAPGYHQSSPFSNSMGASTVPSGPASNHNAYTTPPTTVASSLSPRNGSEKGADISSRSGSFSHSHSHAHGMQCEFGFLDGSRIGSAGMHEPVQTQPGVFENDPQLQIDFILTLEGPCREHTDYLCRRSVTEADDEDMPFSGHALMASCPPPSYIANTTDRNPYPHKTYDLPAANLSTLFNLSKQLVTEGQITPIMALKQLKSEAVYPTLSRDDVRIIMDTLNTKVRCYGFGAVMEDFELADCLSSVLGTKVDAGIHAHSQDELMYA
ncbi:protein flbB [Aspergillus glaucus CBS 516.65]|uniref:BZIP domain-containing protein n=1 Tax=Aspergillus glaucus CBS 516.65 TaxID=1160497 RepID=A0A1L9VKX4_ASPGL|nr:hypothetical protein ASPGLDRAFT_66155 [Aspergillus glaucus CBS 516.65]OJJ84588.1 hypothetical protein ASPGLDRAFT_66155 [Aspergillus glaucus CBS 516.65]